MGMKPRPKPGEVVNLEVYKTICGGKSSTTEWMSSGQRHGSDPHYICRYCGAIDSGARTAQGYK